MRKAFVLVSVLCLALGVFVATAFCERADREVDGIGIMVSPRTIALDSLGGSVSVHTNVPYGLVDTGSLELNGLTPYLTKPDLRGDLVAKFNLDAVKAIVAPPETTLTLTGVFKDGVPFSGTDTVRVVD